MDTITILVPCYNEEAVLQQFYTRVDAVTSSIEGCDFNYLFINDGSTDSTLDILRTLQSKNPKVHYIALSRNFGKETALIAGFDNVDSDAVIVMDADLQHPPEMIPELISWWQQGYKDVCTKRISRDDEPPFKKFASKLYYKILQKMTDFSVQVNVGDFRLIDRQCVEALKLFRESQRYTKGMFSWIGFEKKELPYQPESRAAGKSKWNYFKLVNLAIEGITSFTIVPLRLASLLGCILASTAMLYMLFVVVKTLLYGGDVPGYPSLVSLVLFIGGVQLFFLGIIGEYLGRIFNESKHRPLYLLKERDGKPVIKQVIGMRGQE